MYLQHFALTRFPFETPASSDQLFASQAARDTATRLAYLLELRGSGLLTGEPGCGKTCVCRQVVAGSHPGRTRSATWTSAPDRCSTPIRRSAGNWA